MRIIKKKGRTNNQNSGNVWGSPGARYIGNNTQRTGKPTRPGRVTKSLTGPVHPGFEKSAASYNKKRAATKTVSRPALTLNKVDHSQDLYSNRKTRSKPIRKRRR